AKAGGGAAKPEPKAPESKPAESPPAGGKQPAASEPEPDAAKAAAPSSAKPNGAAKEGRIFASPLARRLAADAGIDLAAIKGSGPNGRIVKADIEGAKAGGTVAAAPAKEAPAKAAAAPAPAAKPAAAGVDAKALAEAYGIPFTEQPNNGMRKTIARRLTEAKQTVPHFYLTLDCEIDALLKLRKDLNEKAGEGIKLSVNDLVIKASALALRKVPAANAAWTEAAILRFDRVDVSVAVATPSGLITPIIKSADQKGLATISAEMKDLAGRARDGKLKPEEFQGGTFSVSNLGMFGIKDFGAIINPPQGCILAVGAGEQRPVVKDGALAVATVMSCTLSVDHRVVDGAIGAEFMAAFKALIENPLSMML
ncbi:MAG: pyruvate dehydrogenase complex dihydrolipoamide acetyltransferase, partial [Inquilinaceae bacterium]